MGEESEVDADQTESPEAADDELSSANGKQSDSSDPETTDGVDATPETSSAVDDNGSQVANESEESTTVDSEAAATSSEADAQSDGGISPVESESPDEDEIIEEAAAAIEDEDEAEEAEGASQTDAGADIEAPTEAATDTGLEVPAVQSPESVDMAEPEPVEPDADESEYDPVQDEEMPLADHIEEMIKRLAAVVVVAGVVSAAIFPFAEFIINHLWDAVIIGSESTRPRVYGPLALKLTELKAASIGGLILALPVAVYETYRFMRPGLYPHERRYYLAAVPTSLILAFVGVSFAYFLVLPAIFTYFLYYSDQVAVIAFGLSKTFNLILLMMGYLALVFQIPLFIMLAIMMGLTTRQWLESRRLYFWGGFLGVSFMFGFDPTGMAPIMVAATMVVLFEGTLALLRWTGR